MLAIAMIGWPALAEDEPKAEVFGGYQYMRIGAVPGMGAHGWNAQVSGYATPWFGIAGDLSGAYRSVGPARFSAHTFTGGPVFVHRGRRVSPFAHLLAGGFSASMGGGPLDVGLDGFAMMTGGGVDVAVSRRVAVRAFQLDWVLWSTSGMTEKKNLRLSAGVVFRIR
jgi:hypothetical protein